MNKNKNKTVSDKELVTLMSAFLFKRPIVIEDNKDDLRTDVVALPDKTILRIGKNTLRDELIESLALAKLAERDYLLATLYVQKDMQPQEVNWMQQFYFACLPLQTAWMYRVMRECSPSIYREAIDGLYNLYKSIIPNPRDYQSNIYVLSIYAALSENPEHDVRMNLISTPEHMADWQKYIAAITEFIHSDIDVSCYCKLPDAINAPYTVSIKVDEDGMRYFDIRGRKKENSVKSQSEKNSEPVNN